MIVCVVLGLARYAVYLSGSMGSMPLFLLASMISGFGGGAVFPLFAAMTADYFGENNNATNYGLVYSSKVIRPGRGRPGLGRVATWGYGAAFVLAGSIGLGSAESVVVTGLARKQLAAVSGGIWVIAWVRTSIWSAAVFARAFAGPQLDRDREQLGGVVAMGGSRSRTLNVAAACPFRCGW